MATCSSFFRVLPLAFRSRAAKPAKKENLRVFIRFDAHVVNAGINLRGCGPYATPWLLMPGLGDAGDRLFGTKKSKIMYF